MSIRHWATRGRTAPSVPAFDPATLFVGFTGVWLDPSDLSKMWQNLAKSTAVAADGDPVRVMIDKGGSVWEYTAPADASRPLYKTSGGLHWLELSAGRILTHATCNALSSKGSFTKIVGIEFTAGSPGSDCVDAIPGAAPVIQRTGTNTFNSYSNPAVFGSSTTGITSLTKYVVSQVFNGSLTATHAARNKFYINGVLEAWEGSSGTINATTAATATAVLGAANSGAAAFMVGRIYQYMAIGGTALSDPDRANAEAYIAAKMGI